MRCPLFLSYADTETWHTQHEKKLGGSRECVAGCKDQKEREREEKVADLAHSPFPVPWNRRLLAIAASFPFRSEQV